MKRVLEHSIHARRVMCPCGGILRFAEGKHEIRCDCGRTHRRVPGVSAKPDYVPDEPVLRYARPFIKAAGGKTGLLPELLARIPEKFGRYFEPFLGGGALFFELARLGRLRHGAVLTDSNRRLMQAWYSLLIDPDGVHEWLRSFARAERKDPEDSYYRERANMNLDSDPIHSRAAARFILLNKTCFNGLYRENRKGEFNVPWGKRESPNIHDIKVIDAAASALRESRAEIAWVDYERALEQAKPGDLVYLDPPYYPLNATSFHRYKGGGFGKAEHVQLAIRVEMLKRAGVHVVLSNSDCPDTRALYAEFAPGLNVEVVSEKRSINSKGDGRGAVTSLIVT